MCMSLALLLRLQVCSFPKKTLGVHKKVQASTSWGFRNSCGTGPSEGLEAGAAECGDSAKADGGRERERERERESTRLQRRNETDSFPKKPPTKK